jgi:hypothetical protein
VKVQALVQCDQKLAPRFHEMRLDFSMPGLFREIIGIPQVIQDRNQAQAFVVSTHWEDQV